MGRELLAEEPVFRRAVEEVSELFAALAGWSLLEKLTADEADSQLQETRFGQPAIFALQVGLAALWRSWGVEPAAVLGHSAGEMAATYIAGALSLEDAVRVTFHRSRLQHRTAGQGVMLAVGISREEAARLVARHPRAISIAAINGCEFDHALRRCRGARRDRQGAQRRGCLQPRACRWTCRITARRWSSSKRSCSRRLRDIRPRPASTPFFSTVTGTALSGSELDARYWYRNVREPVLFPTNHGKRHRGRAPGVPRDRRTSDSQARHRQCLNEKSVPSRRWARCAGRIASERRCWDRSADCTRLAPRSIGSELYPAGRDGDQAADLSVSGGAALAGIRG